MVDTHTHTRTYVRMYGTYRINITLSRASLERRVAQQRLIPVIVQEDSIANVKETPVRNHDESSTVTPHSLVQVIQLILPLELSGRNDAVVPYQLGVGNSLVKLRLQIRKQGKHGLRSSLGRMSETHTSTIQTAVRGFSMLISQPSKL
jgi:hypothetical protein